ncbi:MAG: cellulase family glycosylhydrolase [Sphingomicrobium sp.]
MFTRRGVIAGGSALLGACAAPGVVPGATPSPLGFVRREGTQFRIGGRPYHYAGTNMWYAAFLGADAPIGDRARLGREFDRLTALGVNNVRIAGSAELSPLKNSVTPGFRDRSSNYNETLLRGLDHALAELGSRNMKAVIYLTNFWEWSGGMMTYLFWNNGGNYINMNDPAHPWPEFPDYNSGFYANASAVRMYHDYVRAVVTRRNTVTGKLYVDDPAIMSWQLANEPRPAGSDAKIAQMMPAFLAWVNSTARLIKSLDPNHLVSTGSEGTMGCGGNADCVTHEHSGLDIDYLTAHIWPQNWSWVKADDLAGTWPAAQTKVRDYIAQHVTIAQSLNKPLVIEEFGLGREGGSFDPAAQTTYKDLYYRAIYDAVENSVRSGGPLQGSNFWGWSGEGRAQHPDFHFVRGDTSYVADPPHEPQGWYGVFDSDASTQAIVRAHAAAVGATAA